MKKVAVVFLCVFLLSTTVYLVGDSKPHKWAYAGREVVFDARFGRFRVSVEDVEEVDLSDQFKGREVLRLKNGDVLVGYFPEEYFPFSTGDGSVRVSRDKLKIVRFGKPEKERERERDSSRHFYILTRKGDVVEVLLYGDGLRVESDFCDSVPYEKVLSVEFDDDGNAEIRTEGGETLKCKLSSSSLKVYSPVLGKFQISTRWIKRISKERPASQFGFQLGVDDVRDVGKELSRFLSEIIEKFKSGTEGE